MEAREIFMNYRRLRNIKRANNFPTLLPPDVAQHSYYVALLSMLFVDEVNEWTLTRLGGISRLVDKELVLSKALVHDLEESFISDIVYPVKHHQLVNGTIDSATDMIMKDILESSDESVLNNWEVLRQNCKKGDTGTIVAFCDMLELALYCYEEIITGNTHLEPLLDNCNLYLDELFEFASMSAVNEDFDEIMRNNEILPTIKGLRAMVKKNEDLDKYIPVDYIHAI